MTVTPTAVTATSGASGTTVSNIGVDSGAAVIPAGTVLLFVWCTSTVTASTTGLAASNPITVDAGAIHFEAVDAAATRSSTADTGIARVSVTTDIPAHSTFTVNFRSGAGRTNVVLVNLAGCDNSCEASSQKTTGSAGNINVGPNGASTTPVASTTGAQTTPDALVIAYTSYNAGTTDPSVDSPLTFLAQVGSSVGSGDRGVIVGYQNVSVAAIQTADFSLTVSKGWAAGIAVYPLSAGGGTPPSGPYFAEWDGTEFVTLTVVEWDGLSLNDLSVDETS